MLKNIGLTSLISIIIFSCTATKSNTVIKEITHTYEISYDRGKILKGIISRADIERDTAFKWFDENMKLGKANISAVEEFKKNASNIKMIIFGGTWCEDTQNLLPQFYRLADLSGLPDSSISLIGVDRAKTTLGNLHKIFEIKNVPTFILIKDGKEVGRVIEYGKYGEIDKELGELVNTTFDN